MPTMRGDRAGRKRCSLRCNKAECENVRSTRADSWDEKTQPGGLGAHVRRAGACKDRASGESAQIRRTSKKCLDNDARRRRPTRLGRHCPSFKNMRGIIHPGNVRKARWRVLCEQV